MEAKDLIAIAGIGVTFVVSSANLLYSLWNNKRTSFVNTVTTSRLKWIDSLRDKVSEFIAVTARLMRHEASDKKRPQPSSYNAIHFFTKSFCILTLTTQRIRGLEAWLTTSGNSRTKETSRLRPRKDYSTFETQRVSI